MTNAPAFTTFFAKGPLDTQFAGLTLIPRDRPEDEAIFADLETFEEADGAQLTLFRSEDREIMANSGALPSEVWG